MFDNINWLKENCKINIDSINCPNIFIPQLDQIIKNVDKEKKMIFLRIHRENWKIPVSIILFLKHRGKKIELRLKTQVG